MKSKARKAAEENARKGKTMSTMCCRCGRGMGGDEPRLESFQPMSNEEIQKWEKAYQSAVVERALTLATDFIADRVGACPRDMCDWNHPENCSEVCKSQLSECWAIYFKQKK
jgi:hypothetical protein